jgi:hypothetical protein
VSGRSQANLEPCGTESAHRRHFLHGEPIDDACRLAHNAEARRRYRAKVTPILVRRTEEYAWLREQGIPEWEAARRIGIRSAKYARRYERNYQAQRTQREEVAA